MESMRFFDRRKFLWDGEAYDGTAAAGKRQEYESQGFETQLVEEGGKAFLFTRRVVKEIVLEGEGG